MGIENRDYTRDSSDYTGALTGFGLDYIPPTVKWLIVANAIIFALQMFVTRLATPADAQAAIDRLPKLQREQIARLQEAQRQLQSDKLPLPGEVGGALLAPDANISIVEEWLQLDPRLIVFRGQVWRLLGYAFCHHRYDLWAILVNMLLLYWCGEMLESLLGPREFLLFYLVAAVAAGLVQLGLDLYLGSGLPNIGSSGAVMAAAMVYAIHYPRNTVRLFWFWPIEVRWLLLVYVLYNLHPLLLALGGTQHVTASPFACQLGGLAFGFLYWKFNLNFERWLDMLPKSRGFWSATGSRPRSGRASARREPNIDEQVDDILRKIHESGEASLTAAERRLLARASERYKDRRTDS